jgi:GAF domain-containing protein
MRGERAAPLVAVGELTARVAKLLTTTQTLEAAAQIVLDEVCDTMGYELGHLYHLDPTHESLIASDNWHAGDALRMKPFIDASTSLPISNRFVGRAARYCEPVIVEDVRTHPDFDRRWPARGARLRGGLAFPIASGRDVYGVIEFFDDREAKPDTATIEAIQACVTLIGLIAEQERTRREMAAEQVRILLETTSEPVIATNSTARVIGINEPAEKLFHAVVHVRGRRAHRVRVHPRPRYRCDS